MMRMMDKAAFTVGVSLVRQRDRQREWSPERYSSRDNVDATRNQSRAGKRSMSLPRMGFSVFSVIKTLPGHHLGDGMKCLYRA